ncbi:MAG: hypothetical protein M0P76_02530 [Candidatus Pacebacteria bacterium]|jgi:hypothetical protein|nr:hypothetical protein [Candidatus Paceibacterota bacterium]
MYLGLPVFGTVVIIAFIMVVSVVVLYFVCCYNTNRTKKKTLLKMYLKLLEECSLDGEDYLILRMDAEAAGVEDLLYKFGRIFFLLPLKELKTLEILTPDKDPYGLRWDIDDMRRREIQKKRNREKQEW